MPRATPRRSPSAASSQPVVVERVQTGVRIEKHLLRVLKALAAFHDLSLGDLLEGIVLHAFEGKAAFGPAGLARIRELKRVYELRLDASHSHRLVEQREAGGAALRAHARTAPGRRSKA